MRAEQLGAEASLGGYVSELTASLNEVRRALRPDGTLWLVIGDTIRAGVLLGVPWRVALALVVPGPRLTPEEFLAIIAPGQTQLLDLV